MESEQRIILPPAPMKPTVESREFTLSLLSGACAGLSVDLIIFPLDTLKTRLQSPQGFRNAGGFRNIYAGLASVALGAAPGSASFFVAYDFAKNFLQPLACYDAIAHMAAATLGEVTACAVRVPVEVVKQRTQAYGGTSWNTLKQTLKANGLSGLYRGYGSTVLREIPFSLIQFPSWEYLKKVTSEYQGRPATPFESALCGASSGGIAACVTTPFDVAKTRIMLQEGSTLTILQAFKQVYREGGITKLYAGVVPRSISLSLGGFIFLGMYGKSKNLLEMVL